MKRCEQLFFWTVCFAGVVMTAHSAARPNIVFIFTDDHATQAISAYGGILAKVAPTAHLDQLAADGMRFNRCMVGNSICGPSRATILTGKHSHKNGFKVNEEGVFDGSQQTFPKLLQKAACAFRLSPTGLVKLSRTHSAICRLASKICSRPL
jgi:hypothetical protein